MNIYELRRKRLSQLLSEKYDDNKSSLAKKLGIQQSYLSRVSTTNKNNRRNIGDNLARRIEAVSDKPRGWMDGMSVAAAEVAESPRKYEVEPAVLGIIVRIPILGNTQAGRDGYWEEEVDHPTTASEYIDAPSRDREAYGLRIRGSSMWPRMREGDVLSISPTAECLPGDYVVIRTRAGETLVKELVISRPNEIILNSVGDDQPRIALAAEDIQLMHKVTAIVPGSMIIIP